MPEPRREADEAPERPERDARGRLLPGHSVTVRHGRYSKQALASVAPQVKAIEAAILADLGGPGEVSEVLASTVRDYARSAVLSDVIWGNFVVASPETRRRKSAFNELLRVWERKVTLGRLIGFKRQSKQLPRTGEAWARQLQPSTAIDVRPAASEGADD